MTSYEIHTLMVETFHPYSFNQKIDTHEKGWKNFTMKSTNKFDW